MQEEYVFCCNWWDVYEASWVVLVVKYQLANARDIRDWGSIPRSERFPRRGHGSPCQYSCLENTKDRQAWRATVHMVTMSQTQWKSLSIHASVHFM